MGLFKNRHAVYFAQKRVPEELQCAVAEVLQTGRPRQVFLKRSLNTKDPREARVRAMSVLLEFDHILGMAAKRAATAPVKRELSEREIALVADYVYARELADHEEWRAGGREKWRALYARLKATADHEVGLPALAFDKWPEHGVTREQLEAYREGLADALPDYKDALARGDITAVEDQVDIALSSLGINLAPDSPSWPLLGRAALQSYVKALHAIEHRNAGGLIDVPPLPLPFEQGTTSSASAGTLADALDGWMKEIERPAGTAAEYTRAVKLFTELHGNLPIAALKRSHARTFREALQQVPRRRKGALLRASLPELQEYGRKHPHEPRISVGTVNKNFGAVQTVVMWGHDKGLVPDDVPWSDPFARMRLEEEDSERTAFEFAELNRLFASEVFTRHAFPEGGRGPAAFWLPLLGLFSGARQGELAALKPKNVQPQGRGLTLLHFVRDRTSGKRLKTKSSERVVPVHAELVRLGFLKFVANVASAHGPDAWLFPDIAPGTGNQAAWSKWFGRYLRALGITDTAKVFHSFRHNMKDALRRGGVDSELREALVGHATDSTVSGGYGAKEMAARFGAKRLREAITLVDYEGLKLSRVRPYTRTLFAHASAPTRAKAHSWNARR